MASNAGTRHIGVSAATENAVLLEAEVLPRNDMQALLATRSQFRQNAVAQHKGQTITLNNIRDGLSAIDSNHPWPGISGNIAFGTDSDPIQKTVIVLNGPAIGQVQIKQFFPN